MNSQRYYKPSGRFTPAGVGITLATGVAGIAISALIYGYAIAWIPFVYINVLLIVGYAVICGAIATAGLNFGKVRNIPLAIVLSLSLGFFAVYAAWVVWIFAQSSQELLVLSPTDLLAGIQGLAEVGVWSFKDTTPTGWGLYTFWLLEALSIVGATVYAGYSAVADNPFCETCDCWMDSAKVVGTFDNPSDLSMLKSELEAGRQEAITKLRSTSHDNPSHTVAEVEVCPTCKNYQLLSLKSRELSQNKDGETEVKDKVLMNRLVVDSALVEIMEEHWGQGIESQFAEDSSDEVLAEPTSEEEPSDA